MLNDVGDRTSVLKYRKAFRLGSRVTHTSSDGFGTLLRTGWVDRRVNTRLAPPPHIPPHRLEVIRLSKWELSSSLKDSQVKKHPDHSGPSGTGGLGA